MRSFIERVAALVVILIASVGLFYIGREHKVFLDNKTIEMEGQSFRALKFVRVSVAGKDPIELMPRDRDLLAVVGPSFKLKVEVMDEFGEDVEKTIERELKPGFDKDMMLSMPLLAADRDDYILPPPTGPARPPENDVKPTDELVIPLDAAPPTD
ncbi:hypothetical protein AGMMS50276_25670 [Synergistales bacterium]|nr:hypothetical protein AGMMS50276_25670 [Synergistales bacterium]